MIGRRGRRGGSVSRPPRRRSAAESGKPSDRRQSPRPTSPRASPRGSHLAQKAGGVVAPLLTSLLAFVMGGLVVFVTTGKNPLRPTRRSSRHRAELVLRGRQLRRRRPVSDSRVWFPWNTNGFTSIGGYNLQQTLIADLDADPGRPRGRVRLPLRALQHRRPGAVHRRLARRRCGSGRASSTWRASRTSCCRWRSAASPARCWPASPASSKRPSARTRWWSRSCSTGSCSGRAPGCSASAAA